MIERKQYKIIKEQLFKREAIVIVGPRQVGKTTLLSELVRQTDRKVFSLNCDEPEVQTMLTETNVFKLRALIGKIVPHDSNITKQTRARRWAYSPAVSVTACSWS